MESRLSKAAWMDSFGRELMRLHPTMNAVLAAANAVDAYPGSKGLEPGDAAKAWVHEYGPNDGRPA